MWPDERTWSGTERRDQARRQLLLRRFHDEYQQLPGMSLTADQAARLFAIRADCAGACLKSSLGRRASRMWKDQVRRSLGPGLKRELDAVAVSRFVHRRLRR